MGKKILTSEIFLFQVRRLETLVPKNHFLREVAPFPRSGHTDLYVFPRIEEIIEFMAPSFIFSTLDQAKGYYQFLVDPDSQDKTTFVSEFRNYKFIVLPFGLKMYLLHFNDL